MVNVSSPDASILAIDIGTSSIRAIAYNTAGEPVGFDVRLPYSMDTTHDGGVEIDADRLLDTLCRVLDRVISQHGSDMNSVSAVGMSTFWGLLSISKYIFWELIFFMYFLNYLHALVNLF